ncbi:MAG: glycosyltransferase family A protein [Prevotella sp.]|nr:glycosyltransferase family A protein [Prevotellaceae bacterium]MDY3935555.1 glycosyltransferase family A protein [Prevotella sp.]
MIFTIFTPTYNRAFLLPRLFKSLKQQTFKDFEWLIVDDGSADNTEEVVFAFQKENTTFPIRYIKKENGGKHTAINIGVSLAQGELFFIADSDDILPSVALDIVSSTWNEVKEDSSFCGVCGLDATFEGKIIGTGLPTTYIDGSNIEVRLSMGITGDMKEVFLTSVLKDFPFPEIPGERFCPEVLVWNRMGTKYKLRYINEVIYTAEYQEGGITARITKARMQSPIATMMTYAEMLDYSIPLKVKIRAAINYWRFSFCVDNKTRRPKISRKWEVFKHIGWFMYLKDKQKCK